MAQKNQCAGASFGAAAPSLATKIPSVIMASVPNSKRKIIDLDSASADEGEDLRDCGANHRVASSKQLWI